MAGTYKPVSTPTSRAKQKIKTAASDAMRTPLKVPGVANMPKWNAAPTQRSTPAVSATTPAAAVASSQPQLPPTPIWTPDQLKDKIQFDSLYKDDDSGKGTAIIDLEGQGTQAHTDHDYQNTVNERNATVGQSNVNDDAAARGIIQSSVRDAASYDVEAQRALQSGLIEQNLKNITDAVNNKLNAIRQMRTGYNATYNEQGATQGAQAQAQIIPDAPAPAATPPPAPTTAELIKQWQDRPYEVVAATNSKGEKGVWHNYKDGHRVFVKG